MIPRGPFVIKGRKIRIFSQQGEGRGKNRIYERCDKSSLMLRVGNVTYDLRSGKPAYFGKRVSGKEIDSLSRAAVLRNAGITKLENLNRVAYFAAAEMRRGNFGKADSWIRKFGELQKEISAMHPKIGPIIEDMAVKEGMKLGELETLQKKLARRIIYS
ncbi:MAG: hypothetical protein NTZ73_00090 [Candidatus Diapherotrites archaeon]|nr:hypothetical protein [Candidatus Diapherotrites archaeon]